MTWSWVIDLLPHVLHFLVEGLLTGLQAWPHLLHVGLDAVICFDQPGFYLLGRNELGSDPFLLQPLKMFNALAGDLVAEVWPFRKGS